MTRLTYPVKDIFATLQGEGSHTGKRAVFLRLAGCNVWSGRQEDRARDTAKGCCAAWCDTDFVGGQLMTAQEIATRVRTLWKPGTVIVITGGEPSLLVDRALCAALHGVGTGARIHVETNGSKALPADVDWVTLSPKPPMRVVNQRYDEVKVIYPAGIDPLAYEHLGGALFVQPLDDPKLGSDGVTQCVQFVNAHPSWRLSLQTHKSLGLP